MKVSYSPGCVDFIDLVLHDAIFLTTCLATLEKEIHCMLQKACYTLQSCAATCNGFKNMLQLRASTCSGFKNTLQLRASTCSGFKNTLQLRASTCNGFKNTLQLRASTYNGFKTSLQSFQEVESSSTASVKSGLIISCQNRKHMFANMFFKLLKYA